MSPDRSFAAFLLRASDEFEDGGWVFTGFNLPVLAARVARRRGAEFIQALEAGAAIDRDTHRLLTSTTDYYETAPVTCWRGTTADVLAAIVPKCRRVLIDAANVDIRGRTNTTVIGDWAHPKVRLPGGGGGPEAAYRARHLVLLHGGSRLDRLVSETSPITCAPAPDATVRLITRWGSLTLGDEPRLDVVADGPEADAFVAHAASLGADTGSWTPATEYRPEEYGFAEQVIEEAQSSGYALERGRAPKGEQA
jgi:glutaconate CoA-transferase subunit B